MTPHIGAVARHQKREIAHEKHFFSPRVLFHFFELAKKLPLEPLVKTNHLLMIAFDVQKRFRLSRSQLFRPIFPAFVPINFFNRLKQSVRSEPIPIGLNVLLKIKRKCLAMFLKNSPKKLKLGSLHFVIDTRSPRRKKSAQSLNRRLKRLEPGGR